MTVPGVEPVPFSVSVSVPESESDATLPGKAEMRYV